MYDNEKTPADQQRLIHLTVPSLPVEKSCYFWIYCKSGGIIIYYTSTNIYGKKKKEAPYSGWNRAFSPVIGRKIDGCPPKGGRNPLAAGTSSPMVGRRHLRLPALPPLWSVGRSFPATWHFLPYGRSPSLLAKQKSGMEHFPSRFYQQLTTSNNSYFVPIPLPEAGRTSRLSAWVIRSIISWRKP